MRWATSRSVHRRSVMSVQSLIRAFLLAGSSLLAAIAFCAVAGAQDQPAQSQPAQTPPPPTPLNPAPEPAAPSPAVPQTQPAPPPPPLVRSGGTQLPQITVTAPITKPAARQVVRRT